MIMMEYEAPKLFDGDHLDLLQRIETHQRNERPRRYLRDGQNPREYFSYVEFVKRFRFTKQTAWDTIEPLVAADDGDRRGLPVPPVLKVVIALRFYGSNTFQNVCGDTYAMLIEGNSEQDCKGRVEEEFGRVGEAGELATGQ
ncbi:hypothetical protein PR048_004397 [Dryococelus australis]|uniref:Uncharacterized protein n=1 Tax=Dryococelus australis TaxID=614101 RepID=A0ABQ9I5B5_9NEOP|nr:hypothetical protein PR048_004397 [Dryococelus australis]